MIEVIPSSEPWDDFPPGGVHASPSVRLFFAGGPIRAGELVVATLVGPESSAFPDIDQMIQDLCPHFEPRIFALDDRQADFEALRHEIAKSMGRPHSYLPSHLLIQHA